MPFGVSWLTWSAWSVFFSIFTGFYLKININIFSLLNKNSNFEMDQSGIKRQLSHLRLLLHAIDPHLASYLDTRDSGNLFFCFRWLLVLFKREFNYPDVLRLWEVLWTDGPYWKRDDNSTLWHSSLNFHLIVALSILDSQRSTILENRFGFTEILKVRREDI